MLYKITNTGEARTVDFLAVFAEGETKVFTDDDLRNCQRMSGVPLDSLLGDGSFEFAKYEGTPEDLEAKAIEEQEANVAKLNSLATPTTTEGEEA